MPIEKESKIVLKPEVSSIFNITKRLPGMEKFFIFQLYLGGGARIRHRKNLQTQVKEYFFTYKKNISNDEEIEIETEISADDFGMLVEHSEESLIKVRFSIKTENAQWDLDAFHESLDRDDKPYFVMLEVEWLTDEQPDWSWIPEDIILKIVEDNSEYSSKKLSNINYAEQSLKELGFRRI